MSAVGADASGRTALDWGLYGVPETYVIDSDGIIVLRFAGPITERVLRETIRPAIVEAQEARVSLAEVRGRNGQSQKAQSLEDGIGTTSARRCFGFLFMRFF